jgi:hypothetical protein
VFSRRDTTDWEPVPQYLFNDLHRFRRLTTRLVLAMGRTRRMAKAHSTRNSAFLLETYLHAKLHVGEVLPWVRHLSAKCLTVLIRSSDNQ